MSDNQPTPDISTVTAIVAGIGAMIASVIAWLDKRTKKQRDEVVREHSAQITVLETQIAQIATLEAKIGHMAEQIDSLDEKVKKLENGQRHARGLLVEVIVLTELDAIRAKVKDAIEALH